MFHFAQGKTGRLNEAEKKIVKYLLGEEWRNQDILALINLERPATVNPGRVAEVKKDSTQVAAKATEYESYFRFKRSFDLKTGLNPFLDERLIKSREAMKMVSVSLTTQHWSFAQRPSRCYPTSHGLIWRWNFQTGMAIQ